MGGTRREGEQGEKGWKKRPLGRTGCVKATTTTNDNDNGRRTSQSRQLHVLAFLSCLQKGFTSAYERNWEKWGRGMSEAEICEGKKQKYVWVRRGVV